MRSRNLFIALTALVLVMGLNFLLGQGVQPGNGGAAGGDLSGAYPNPSVVSLGGGDATYASHLLTLPSATGVIAFGTDTAFSRCAASTLCVNSTNAQGGSGGALKFNGVTTGFTNGFGWQYNVNATTFSFGPSVAIAWGATNQTGSFDSGISRDAAGVVDVGNGTAGDKSGTLQYKSVVVTATAFASLGTPANGTQLYCNDCTIANPCAGSGTGAFGKRLNGVWVCN